MFRVIALSLALSMFSWTTSLAYEFKPYHFYMAGLTSENVPWMFRGGDGFKTRAECEVFAQQSANKLANSDYQIILNSGKVLYVHVIACTTDGDTI